MKILIAADNGVKRENFEIAFKEIAKEHEVKIIEVDRNLTFTPTTNSEKNIKEYIGSPRQLVKEIDEADILVVNYAPVTEEVMDADKNLKLIGVTRGGPVNVDLQAATKRGIFVVNAPERTVDAVADFTIGLMIAEARNLARAYHMLKTGKVLKINPRLFGDAIIQGIELPGKTLGIIGFGRIGRAVAVRAKGFGMRILAYDPYVKEDEIRNCGVEPVNLETLLKESDFISLHVRLTKETEHMIGEGELKRMKKTAYLINTSRGKVVDEKALYKALKEKWIAGAALDVVEEEPISPANPLLKLDNVTVTPHIAGLTQEVPLKSALIIADEITRYIRGERLSRLVNKELQKI
ncbi:MAG: 2-hydroxyacid dehydrogenase [Nitrososphaeria archaeon]|nr:2-hydroxyacid dehydrogenase [Nitrososphaeria archaeon]